MQGSSYESQVHGKVSAIQPLTCYTLLTARYCRYDGPTATEKWDPDWVIPSTHRKIEEYFYISSGNFQDDTWLESVPKIVKLQDGSIQDFEANIYGYPMELLACHSTWGDRFCDGMRGADKDNMKKLNACVPSAAWVKEQWDQIKGKVWELNGIRLQLQMDASDDEEEDQSMEDMPPLEWATDEEDEKEKELLEKSKAESLSFKKTRRGKKATPPNADAAAHQSSDDDSSSESESEDEDQDKLDKWAARMAEEEAIDRDDGNDTAISVQDLSSLAAIQETEEDKAAIQTPSKHASSKQPQELYSPNKVASEPTGSLLLACLILSHMLVSSHLLLHAIGR